MGFVRLRFEGLIYGRNYYHHHYHYYYYYYYFFFGGGAGGAYRNQTFQLVFKQAGGKLERLELESERHACVSELTP